MRHNKHITGGRAASVSLLVFSFYLLLSFSLTSCSGEYVGVPRAEVLRYQTVPTYGGLHTLAMAYGEALNNAVKVDTLHPGMYAEYGVTLALMGHTGAACRMLNAEMKAFPESRGMVQRIKQRLMPEMLGDTLASGRDTANLAQLAEWGYDSLAALQPLPYVAPVIDSSDSAWISQQTPVDSVEYPIRLTANEKRELLAKQQAEEAEHQKFIADSIEAVKKAAIAAKKQEKIDRENAKKEKEKAREQAKKEKEKAREQEKKEKQKAREEEQKAKQKQREEERKQKAEERERQKQEGKKK